MEPNDRQGPSLSANWYQKIAARWTLTPSSGIDVVSRWDARCGWARSQMQKTLEHAITLWQPVLQTWQDTVPYIWKEGSKQRSVFQSADADVFQDTGDRVQSALRIFWSRVHFKSFAEWLTSLGSVRLPTWHMSKRLQSVLLTISCIPGIFFMRDPDGFSWWKWLWLATWNLYRTIPRLICHKICCLFKKIFSQSSGLLLSLYWFHKHQGKHPRLYYKFLGRKHTIWVNNFCCPCWVLRSPWASPKRQAFPFCLMTWFVSSLWSWHITSSRSNRAWCICGSGICERSFSNFTRRFTCFWKEAVWTSCGGKNQNPTYPREHHAVCLYWLGRLRFLRWAKISFMVPSMLCMRWLRFWFSWNMWFTWSCRIATGADSHHLGHGAPLLLAVFVHLGLDMVPWHFWACDWLLGLGVLLVFLLFDLLVELLFDIHDILLMCLLGALLVLADEPLGPLVVRKGLGERNSQLGLPEGNLLGFQFLESQLLELWTVGPGLGCPRTWHEVESGAGRVTCWDNSAAEDNESLRLELGPLLWLCTSRADTVGSGHFMASWWLPLVGGPETCLALSCSLQPSSTYSLSADFGTTGDGWLVLSCQVICADSSDCHNWFRSIRNIFSESVQLEWPCWGVCSTLFLDQCRSRPESLSNALEIRNGALPSITTIRKKSSPSGTMRACLLTNVCWLPKRNIRLRGWRFTLLRTHSGIWLKNSRTWRLPMTVWEAPKSTIPTEPADANRLMRSDSESSSVLRGSLRRSFSWCNWRTRSAVSLSDAEVLEGCWLRWQLRLGLQIPRLPIVVPTFNWTAKHHSWLFDSDLSSVVVRWNISSGTSDAVTNEVGAVDGAATDDELRDWHSFFQWPFFR